MEGSLLLQQGWGLRVDGTPAFQEEIADQTRWSRTYISLRIPAAFPLQWPLSLGCVWGKPAREQTLGPPVLFLGLGFKYLLKSFLPEVLWICLSGQDRR